MISVKFFYVKFFVVFILTVKTIKEAIKKNILFYLGDMIGFNSTNCWWYASFNIKRRY